MNEKSLISTSEKLPPARCKPRSHAGSRIILSLFLALAIGGALYLAVKIGAITLLLGWLGKAPTGHRPSALSRLYAFDLSRVSEGAHGIIPTDKSIQAAGFRFEPQGLVDTDGILPIPLPKVEEEKITVLVVNTHPYEAYSEVVSHEYRSTDFVNSSEQMVTVRAVADAFCKALEKESIGVLYVSVSSDGGRDSYKNAALALTDALTMHPDVAYILDIHRGIMTDKDGNLLRPVTLVGDQPTAQARLVVGAGDAADEELAYRLGTAATVMQAASETAPSLLMPTAISESRLNQHLPATCFTLEIGTCGNSIEEAVNAASLLGELFAKAIKE